MPGVAAASGAISSVEPVIPCAKTVTGEPSPCTSTQSCPSGPSTSMLAGYPEQGTHGGTSKSAVTDPAQEAISMKNRIGRLQRTAAACALAALALAVTPGHAAGPNLLPNASFERSIVEPPAPVPPYSNPQPALPEGWAFEGAAGLFDHSQNAASSGRRSAAISIPLSGKRRQCVDPAVPCVDDPTTDAKENTAAVYYSIPPAWRNATPVTVVGSKSYTLSAFMKVALVTIGESAIMRVRWLDANGLPISISNGPKLVSAGQAGSAWTSKTATVTSPAGARQAVVLLGHSTDSWIGQVLFDQVYFGTTV